MGSEISNFLSGGQQKGYQDIVDAFGKAMDYSKQSQQQGQQTLDPYEKAGQGAIDPYQKFVNGLPDQMNGKWMDNYKQSDYAKYLTSTGLNSMNNAAAATGTLGSGVNQQQNASLASSIAGQDMQNYFNNMMAQNNQYMGGQQDLMHTGANTAVAGAGINQQYASDIAKMMQGQGEAQGGADRAGTKGVKDTIQGLMHGASSGGW